MIASRAAYAHTPMSKEIFSLRSPRKHRFSSTPLYRILLSSDSIEHTCTGYDKGIGHSETCGIHRGIGNCFRWPRGGLPGLSLPDKVECSLWEHAFWLSSFSCRSIQAVVLRFLPNAVEPLPYQPWRQARHRAVIRPGSGLRVRGQDILLSDMPPEQIVGVKDRVGPVRN